MQIGVTRISVPRNFENGTYMKIEYIQNVNAVQSLSDLIMELRIACFGKHLKNWIWMLVMPHGFTSPAAATTASTIWGSTYASAGPAQELANVNVALTDHMIY